MRAAQHHLRQLRELELLGPVFSDQRGGDRADGRGFRRIGEAAEDGADDDDRDQQGGRRPQDRHDALARRLIVGAGIVVDISHQRDDEAEHHREDDARHDAGDQHVADRDLREHAVDHEHHRRRNDRAEHAAIGGEARREGLVVALLLHLRHHDLRHDRDLRGRRSQDRGDEHVGEDVDVGEPALQRADERHRHVDDAPGDAAAVHDLADQDEERNGDQAVAVDAAEQLERIGLEQHRIAGCRDVDEAGEAQAEADRHADQHDRDEGG